MNAFEIGAIVLLLITAVMLARGIRSMMRGGEEDSEASTRLMWRRVEFQAAAVALILAAILFAVGQ